MSFDPITYDAVERLSTKLAILGQIAHFPSSGTLTAIRNGYFVVRAMGAGGSGARGVGYQSGGNGASVAIKRIPVSAGDVLSIVVPAGAAPSVNGPGVQGGTLTATCGAWTGTIPGGNGGVVGNGQRPADNTPPTGWDAYWLGGLGGSSNQNTPSYTAAGGSAPLLNGTSKGFNGGRCLSAASSASGAGVGGDGMDSTAGSTAYGGGSGGPGTGAAIGPNLFGLSDANPATTDVAHSRLLVNVSGGGAAGNTPAGPGGGGGAGAGRAGFGGGGGSGASQPGRGGGSGSASGNPAGGDGWVTVEVWEAA